jgi:hypothetical protein
VYRAPSFRISHFFYVFYLFCGKILIFGLSVLWGK